ncbi:hypothetical protein [Flexithrix dorotheae]|uniref:hypothetical protein n=1 Tax=Flexithrix dorotheae TaxID=70993 RepID=UPI0012FB7C0C|nr:hypothetical protein [Flexithrix dorotheae]
MGKLPFTKKLFTFLAVIFISIMLQSCIHCIMCPSCCQEANTSLHKQKAGEKVYAKKIIKSPFAHPQKFSGNKYKPQKD